MAFLDNSGDIILDATLTDTGRRRMAQGKFRIAKYALGDDEIDYSLYNKNHPSGSAYYDLQILQTPIFEAFSKNSANINYGLLSNTRMDLLYLPHILPNNKIASSVSLSGSVYYCAANVETHRKIATTWGSGIRADDYLLLQGDRSRNFIALESGMNTEDFLATPTTRNNYIINTGLKDSEFNVYCDRRFIAGVMGPGAGAVFSNNVDGTLISTLMPLAPPTYGGGGRRRSGYDYYKTAQVGGADNLIYFYPGASVADSDHSVLAGPRGTITTLNFSIKAELTSLAGGVRSALWEQYGTKAQAIFGGSNLFDYIDTTVYVQGASSTSRTQFNLRIIRYAGT